MLSLEQQRDSAGPERTGSGSSASAGVASAGEGSPGGCGRRAIDVVSAQSNFSSSADEDTCGICFDNEDHVAIKYW